MDKINELYEKFETMKEKIGVESMLDQLYNFFSTDDAEDYLRLLDRDNDTNMFEEEEEEEE